MATPTERTLLGVCDEEIPPAYATSWQCNKFGGRPDWMHPGSPYPQCIACGVPMYLVTQLYCPLEAVPYHRTIYVFTCIGKTCLNRPGSWRVFRSQLPVTSLPSEGGMQASAPAPSQAAVAALTDDWCEDADDWGSEEEEEEEEESPAHMGVAPGPRPLAPPDPGRLADVGVNGREREGCLASGADWTAASTGATDAGSASRESSSSREWNSVGIRPQAVPGEEWAEREVLRPASPSAGRGSVGDPASAKAEKEDEEEEEEEEEATRAMEQLSVSCGDYGASPLPVATALPPAFRPHFVSVFDEPAADSAARGPSIHERALMAAYQQREGLDLLEWQERLLQTRISSGDESYEKSTAKHGDKAFQAFSKRVQLCPEQCVRYSWNGRPLYLTSPDEGAVTPPCASCGGQLVFELQLMPALISVLQDTEHTDASVEFGVVVVHTCQASCWPQSGQPGHRPLVEECAALQAEPDLGFLDRATSGPASAAGHTTFDPITVTAGDVEKSRHCADQPSGC